MADRIVVAGGGFAGLWAAAAAARARALAKRSADDLDIVLVDPSAFHTIRVRCYEADLAPIRVPFASLLGPIGVRHVAACVTAIDARSRGLTLVSGTGAAADGLAYGRLVLATGSALAPPPVPVHAPTFDVDTFAGGERLHAHLAGLAAGPATERARTAVVVGGGSVGIEIACELPGRLRALFTTGPIRVVMLDRGEAGSWMGHGAPRVRQALTACGVEVLSHTALASVDADGVTLGDGTRIVAATVILATGMRASPLAGTLGVPCDRLGRLNVDPYLAVEGIPAIHAAGDCASAVADDAGHRTLMSCQHARPMGRIAGHNAACDILGRPDERVAFSAPDYVTVLDLGPEGALYTSGWDRETIVAAGDKAKAVKRTINRSRIYPPDPPTREAMFAAAAPVIQARPAASGGTA
jgi:NADH dehydrogenase